MSTVVRVQVVYYSYRLDRKQNVHHHYCTNYDEHHGAEARTRAHRCYVHTGLATISPCGLEHQREGLALGALRALETSVKGIDDGFEPAVDSKVWGVRECTRRRGLRPCRGPARRG